jgi:hypothetical protein
LDIAFDESELIGNHMVDYKKMRWTPENEGNYPEMLLSPADSCLEYLVTFHLQHDINLIALINHVINHHGANPEVGLATVSEIAEFGSDKGLFAHFTTVHEVDNWDVCLVGAARGGSLAWVEFYIEKGAIVFETAFKIAVLNEKEDLVAFFIENEYVHFNEHIRDELSWFAYHMIREESGDIIRFLTDFHIP